MLERYKKKNKAVDKNKNTKKIAETKKKNNSNKSARVPKIYIQN